MRSCSRSNGPETIMAHRILGRVLDGRRPLRAHASQSMASRSGRSMTSSQSSMSARTGAVPGVTIGIMGMSGSSVQEMHAGPSRIPVPQFSARSPMALGMIICNKLGWCGMNARSLVPQHAQEKVLAFRDLFHVAPPVHFVFARVCAGSRRAPEAPLLQGAASLRARLWTARSPRAVQAADFVLALCFRARKGVFFHALKSRLFALVVHLVLLDDGHHRPG